MGTCAGAAARPGPTRPPPDVAAEQVEAFARALEARGVSKVGRGEFGAHMAVELVNDGPVTIWLDAAAP